MGDDEAFAVIKRPRSNKRDRYRRTAEIYDTGLFFGTEPDSVKPWRVC